MAGAVGTARFLQSNGTARNYVQKLILPSHSKNSGIRKIFSDIPSTLNEAELESAPLPTGLSKPVHM